MEDCLALYPQQHGELESLLRLAVQLQAGQNLIRETQTDKKKDARQPTQATSA